MDSIYEREDLLITEFDIEDVITTSGIGQGSEKENAYGDSDELDNPPGLWY